MRAGTSSRVSIHAAVAGPGKAEANHRRAIVEMGYVNIQRHYANEDASNQCDHVARLIIQVGTLDHGEAREQRLALNFR
jgi:hypothetical protein